MAHDVLDLSGLQTEAINELTSHIDRGSTLQMCAIINDEDKTVADSVTPCIGDIARAIDLLLPRVRSGGRVIYVGAGTSGRLGVLDSSEIPPTFAAPPTQFVGLIAGGDAAIRQAQEGAEDSPIAGKDDLVALNLDAERDSVIGIAASGRTPYVLGALEYAKGVGCLTIGVACVSPSEMGQLGALDVMISPLPGPEVVTGSTRLKAGTATKMVLNMLSTGTMIKAGKTSGNMMVDLIASNKKLKQRSRNILRKVSKHCSLMADHDLDDLLARCNGRVKLAIVVAEKGTSIEQSQLELDMAQGVLAKVLAHENGSQVEQPLVNGSNRHRAVLCIDEYDTSMNSVITAARKALKNLPRTTQELNGINGSIHSSNNQESFSSIWVAAAGMDRPGMKERVQATITQQLDLDKSVQVRVSNDVDLLAAAMVRHPEVSSSLVVIAGTGSIAIRYALESNDGTPKRVARAGGWGHLLGDEGAGFAIGRQAVRKTLCSLEEINLGHRRAGLSPLDTKVVEFFSGSLLGRESDLSNIDLLSNVLTASDEGTAKGRIASIAQTVLDLAGAGNAEAVDIISQQVSNFVDNTLRRLLNPQSQGYVDPSRCGLILSGSVMLHSVYQTVYQLALAKHGIRFCYTEAVPNAAVIGVEYLLASEARPKLSNGVS
ncbi:hypothetical protein UA08_08459 [Talaromyces atroroseus]|uniref:SIS domain-containing protein n=1 Tax=Talaromyces atroroseus TaxID=1441469 RepID=A0A1Q5Q7R3_TALAT|nr:hypothetical protein UA08_08459 [Talaromyces atroroseus]OKL56265.1 hypothetical protein UA08_08459 [Talaromyces atroroseus]